MNIEELIEMLEELKKSGKGKYVVMQDGYARELDKENIWIKEEKREIWM